MAIKFSKTKAATATVSKEMKEKGATVAETHKTEQVAVPDEVASSTKTVGAPWCDVGFEASYTHNLGNYQSCRIGVHLHVMCKPNEVDEVYDYSEKWVNERMEKAIAELEDDK